MENLSQRGNESFTTYETLGILWLYCGLNKSIEYFENALALKPKDEKANVTLVILQNKLNELKNLEHN